MKDRFVKFPIGIQDFQKLIEGGYVYIDKTGYIYDLAQNSTPVFLSRPRRFGKSLFLSTLKAYWEGKRELFRGLKIEELEADNPKAWEPYPVFYFDFNGKNYQTENSLESALDDHLRKWELIYQNEYYKQSLEARFQSLLQKAAEKTGKRCVILIDEYDKSLLETMENSELHEHNKAIFKGFFSTLKSYDAYIKFIFITGVTKFSKVSLFSDLNQLEDISFDNEYSGLCGITEKEIRDNFQNEVEMMSADLNISVNECFQRLKIWYDGYQFSSEGVGVYNPFSLLCSLKKKRFSTFWFQTATPTFLTKKLRAINFNVKALDEEKLETSESVLSDYRIENPDPVPLLYQTGYLTIKAYTEYIDEGLYTLGFPNSEVRYAFLQSLMPEYVENCGAGSGKEYLFTETLY